MKLILVSSLKGGVGKTTISIGLARALKRRGEQVGILDIDTRTPNVPAALGGLAETARLQRTSKDEIIPPEIDGIQVMSMAYIWPEGRAVEVEDQDTLEDVLQLLTPGIIAWDPSYLIVDSPPTATGVIKAALQANNLLGGIIVSQPSRVSRADCLRTIDLFREYQVPVIGLVANMGRSEQTGEQMFDLSDDDMKAIAVEHKLSLFFTIPYTKRLDEYFDRLAELVLNGAKPMILPKTVYSDETWRRMVAAIQKMKERRGG